EPAAPLAAGPARGCRPAELRQAGASGAEPDGRALPAIPAPLPGAPGRAGVDRPGRPAARRARARRRRGPAQTQPAQAEGRWLRPRSRAGKYAPEGLAAAKARARMRDLTSPRRAVGP